jgi:hypothetical protein
MYFRASFFTILISGILMQKKPVFAGLVFDENDHQVETAFVGEDPCYVVDDAGFRRHIPAEYVDLQKQCKR